jgi:hypothetical protein
MEGDDPANLDGAVTGMESAVEAMSDWVSQRGPRPRSGPGLDLEL